MAILNLFDQFPIVSRKETDTPIAPCTYDKLTVLVHTNWTALNLWNGYFQLRLHILQSPDYYLVWWTCQNNVRARFWKYHLIDFFLYTYVKHFSLQSVTKKTINHCFLGWDKCYSIDEIRDRDNFLIESDLFYDFELLNFNNRNESFLGNNKKVFRIDLFDNFDTRDNDSFFWSHSDLFTFWNIDFCNVSVFTDCITKRVILVKK